MKTKRYFSASVVFAVILCVPVLGNIQMLKSGERQHIKRPWGVLANLDTIDSFDMTVLCPDPNKDTEFWKDLYDKVVARFPERIRMRLTLRSYLDNIYKIRIEIFGFEDSPNYVARVQSSLTSNVSVKNGWALAEVWMAEPAMKVVQMQNLHEAVSAMVLEQAEEFIGDYQKANPPGTRASNVSDANVVPETGAAKSPAKTAEQPSAEYQFVASRISDVFHRPDCTSARKIKPANLVGYTSRQAAIETGKRPCKICKP
jgi:hypothetical protein